MIRRTLFLYLCFSVKLLLAEHVDSEESAPTLTKNVSVLQFSDPVLTAKYEASSDFDPRGMEHLYTVTNLFLDFIQKEGLPSGVITQEVFRSPLKVINKNRGELLSHFLGMVLVGSCGLVLAVLLPISGLLFCCCRCAGRCGSRKDVMEKRRDPCHRVIYGFLMFIFLLIMLFGVVCAFVTNEYVEQGVQALPQTLKQSMTDVDVFLNNTNMEVNNLLKSNFDQLQNRLEESLDRSGDIVKTRLGEVSQAASVDNLTEIVSRLSQIQNRLHTAVQSTKELQQQAADLELKLSGVRLNLINLTNDCTSDDCQLALKEYSIDSLTVAADIHKLPNLTSIVNNISSLVNQDIEEEVRKGKNAFDQLSETIQSTVNKTIPDIKSKIDKVRLQLASAADNISDALHIPKIQHGQKFVMEVEPHIMEYARYRWYACIGFCCGMLAVILCFTFGLICGSCGRRPGNVYGDNNCSKGSGANFLMFGVVLVFIFSFYLLVAMTALFLVGGVTERAVCDVIVNTSNVQFQKVVMLVQDHYVEQSVVSGIQLDFVDVLRKCHNNESLYKALGLEEHDRIQIGQKTFQMFNLSDIRNYRQHYEVDAKLEEFLHHLNISPNVTVLTTQGEELLKRLKDTPVSSINFTAYFSIAQQHITAINLLDVAMYLNQTASTLSSSEHRTATRLRDLSSRLADYYNSLVIPILKNLEKLKEVAEQLQKDAEFGGRSLQEAITELLEKAQAAQEFIQTKGKEELKKLAEEFLSEFTGLMDRYATHVQLQVVTSVGRCGPVSRAYNASVTGVCSEILLPLNGFWASLGWCTLICIPGLIVAVVLAVLYRRTDPYPGPLVDSEYNSDSYMDRDNIPLAHVNRKHGHSDREIYENRNGYIHDYSPGYRERVPLAAANYLPSRQVDYTRGLETGDPTFTAYHPTSSGVHRNQPSSSSHRGGEFSPPPEYAKPPPYYFPGPS